MDIYIPQATVSPVLRQYNTSVQNAWYNLKQAGFRAFLEKQGSEKDDGSSRYSRSVWGGIVGGGGGGGA